MLKDKIDNFLHYCQVSNFSDKSIESLSARLKEFKNFISSTCIESLQEITYQHLLTFVADFGNSSVHIKKARVWTLQQFFHFLKLNRVIDVNIAKDLPYPKIEKTVPEYLTIDEYNRILYYFYERVDSVIGLRNLIIIMILGFLGLRISSVTSLNIEDVDLLCGLIRVVEKGKRTRNLTLPKILCQFLHKYLCMRGQRQGPLFLSKRNRRISERTLQDIFHQASCDLGIDKRLHAHLFRHTAATHLNKVAGTDITQYVLGHDWRKNTERYTHLNPDQYAVYMKNHPYMDL